MKKRLLGLFLFVSTVGLGAMERDVRLTIPGQGRYFFAIGDLINEGNLEEAWERIEFLRRAPIRYVQEDQLNEMAARIEAATKKREEARVRREMQKALLQEYERIEPYVFVYRDERNIDDEREALIMLWENGKALDQEPQTLPAHMIRLFQIENCGLAREKSDLLLINLITYLSQTRDAVAHEVFELMNYGDESRIPCSFPFQRLFDEAKRTADIERANALFKFLMIVGDADMRGYASIKLAGEDPEAGVQEIVRMNEIARRSPEDRIQGYLRDSDDDLAFALQLAQVAGDEEAMNHFLVQIADQY